MTRLAAARAALALVLELALAHSSRAERLPAARFTAEQGLAHDRVTCVRTDARGLLWFGTGEGLSRFDGVGFATFGREHGLPSGAVTDLAEASDSGFWVATELGLYRFTPTAAEPGAQRWFRPAPLAVGGPLAVRRLHRDRQGVLWVGAKEGLFRLREDQGGRSESVAVGELAGESHDVRALAEAPDGSLWVGGEFGLLRRDRNGHPASLPLAADQTRVRALWIDPDGRAWVGTEGGLSVFAPGAGAVLALGVHLITLTVDDGKGGSDTDEVVITVEDTTPPAIGVGAAVERLWPPSHAYHTVALATLGLVVTDACDSTLTAADVLLTEVVSDEPENGPDDGDTVQDIAIAPDCRSVELRAERQGSGNGRVYTLALAVADGAQNVGTATHQAHVPVGRHDAVTDDGVGAGYTQAGCPVP